jgi:EAL domain-containing protein (putative c-di-GMP-specific phosphodiesterase class I)/CheY-like chemotaxis protein
LNVAASTHPTGARILLVDDDALFLEGVSRALASFGYQTCKAYNGREASDLVARQSFDTVIADVRMPDMDGIELLTALRRQDDELPVILITASPDVNSAAEAVALRAFAYLTKPLDLTELRRVIGRAIHAAGMARIKSQALLLASEGGLAGVDHPGLEQSFRRALDTLWMAYQPIVRVVDRSLFGYEALLRSDEKMLPDPEAVLSAAERLGRLPKLGRKIWAAAAGTFSGAEDHALLFVNLHAADLWDPMLASPSAPLVAMADRVVLEVTERASIHNVDAARERLAELRGLGFRIAIDDLGAGYAGLTSFAAMEPQFAKLDASIVRGVDRNRTKQKIISSLYSLCNDLSIVVVAEGVETTEERDVLVDLGCDLLQGYLFAKPGRPFPQFTW